MPENDVPSASGSIDVATHPLVDKLLPDVDSPKKKVVFAGYVGPSKDGSKLRLYVDLSFDRYLEIPKSAVVASEQSVSGDENSPTVIFVAADAQVDQVSTTTQSGPAAFLSGSIASGSMSASSRAGGIGLNNQVDCCGTFFTAGCTFPSGAAAAPQRTGANVDCCGTFFTAGCTFPSGAAAAPQRTGANVDCCGTFFTAGCTFPSGAAAAAQRTGANVDCCGTFFTAGCTFPSGAAAAAQRTGSSGQCGYITGTLACTFDAAQGRMAAGAVGTDCGRVTGTLACTFDAAQVKMGSDTGCCGTLWTAGCTFPSNVANPTGS